MAKKTQKKKPKVVAVVACDSIMHQTPSGKTTLIGVFDRINVGNPEKPFRPFTVMTRLFGGSGQFEAGIRLTTPAGGSEQLGEGHVIDCGPDDVFQGTATISNMDVSKPGIAKVYVTLDGKPAGNPCPIRIIHTQKESDSDE